MKSGWEPEQRDLGDLGLAGIFRETILVVRRVFLPNYGGTLLRPLLTDCFIANAVFCSPHCLDLGVFFFYVQILALLLQPQVLILLTPDYVFCVASLYCTGGGLRAAHSVLNERIPAVPLRRLFCTFYLVALPILVIFTSLSVAALLGLDDKILLAMRLLGLASAAYAAVVGHLACVVSVLEDAVLFGAVRRSRELLAGKFWMVATFFLTLDGCIIALLVAFQALMTDGARSLGFGFRLAAVTAIYGALPRLLHVALVAQPVAYMVCKSHRQEVVDLVQLHGSTTLAVDGDN
jgi:hypothetical protein